MGALKQRSFHHSGRSCPLTTTSHIHATLTPSTCEADVRRMPGFPHGLGRISSGRDYRSHSDHYCVKSASIMKEAMGNCSISHKRSFYPRVLPVVG